MPATDNTPHVVFVAGEDGASQVGLQCLAREISEQFGLRATNLNCYANPGSLSHLPGLEALEEADVAVFYLRFLSIPEAQLGQIRSYLGFGKPALWLRTTARGFRYPKGHPPADWNTQWPQAPGVPWMQHYDDASTADASTPEGAEGHPILTGAEPQLRVPPWPNELAANDPPQDAAGLLAGEFPDPGYPERRDARPLNPVAYVHTHPWGGRIVTTTIGHPDDFFVPEFHRLMVNAIHWLLELPCPF